MEQNNDHVLSSMAAELSAMLVLENETIDFEPESLDRWIGSMGRRSDFDPDLLAVEVVALSLKIRRLAAEAGAPAVAHLQRIAEMLMDRIDPEAGAELRLTLEGALTKTTGTTSVPRRAPIYDQPAPAGTFTIKSLGPRQEGPRRRKR
jgi:hypothetical protein